jgi:hypothetical protein
MRVARFIVPLFCIVVVAVVIFSNNTTFTSAQAVPVCSIMSQGDLKAATDACGKADSASACLGHTGAKVTLVDGSTADFKAAGDKVDLSKVATLTTSVTDPASGNAGVAVLNLQAGLSSGDQLPTAVLFGDASLNFVSADASPATEPAPSGQSNGEAFTLNTAAVAKASCGVVPSGLLIQSSADKTAHLLVNGVDVTFDKATLLLRAKPNDRLEVAAIDGKATVKAKGGSVEVAANNWTRVRLGGKDGLVPSAPPPAPVLYSFAALDGAPLAFLPTMPACTVGLSATSTGKVSVRVGPGTERGPLFFMDTTQNFAVKGQGKDSTGAMWWQIQAGNRPEAWVAQSEVHTIGVCENIPQATPPPVIVAVPNPPTEGPQAPGATAQSVSQGFAPTGRTIWQATVGPLSTSGTCTKVPVAYCDQLVSIIPSGTGLLWRGQELQPYYMTRIRENVYAYSGTNPLGDAKISLTVQFTSQTGFKATQTLIPNDDPGCKNTFTFSGQFLR